MRRSHLLLFIVSFLTFAWFHQGGGWNQNARFAEVRAIVEEGTFAVDDFLIYFPTGEGRQMARAQVREGEYQRDGVHYQLAWGDWANVGTLEKPEWQQLTVNGEPAAKDATLVLLGDVSASGDVGYAPDRHFHPNKPPGASLLAVPVYFVLYHVERWCGWNADDWWVLNVNVWLCSVFTVGLISALGVVLLARLAEQLVPKNPGAAWAAAVCVGIGTTYFPFATLLFDHNLTAVLLLASFGAVRSGRPGLGGIAAGVAAVTNYLAAIPGAMFGLWTLLGAGQKKAPAWKSAVLFTAGVVPSLIGLLAYNTAAFGSPFMLNTSFQNPAFKEVAPAFLGMFTAPSWFSALVITVSPWRGLFVLCPVLLLAVAALVGWWRRGEWPAERRLVVAVAGFFFLVNVCFNGFHGGFAAGPRYLIPVLPLLGLPLAAAFARWPVTTWALGLLSIFQNALLTVTDAQNPVGVGDHAWQNVPGEWRKKIYGNSLVWSYAWPLFAQGRAEPVIKAELEEWAQKRSWELEKKGVPHQEREQQLAAMVADAKEKIARGEREPLWMAAMPGPVAMNVMGPWDGAYFQHFKEHTEANTWASFNAGEFALPGSRWSVAPLFLLWMVAARRKKK